MATAVADAEGVTEEQFYQSRCAELEAVVEAQKVDIKQRFVLIHTFVRNTNLLVNFVFLE